MPRLTRLYILHIVSITTQQTLRRYGWRTNGEAERGVALHVLRARRLSSHSFHGSVGLLLNWVCRRCGLLQNTTQSWTCTVWWCTGSTGLTINFLANISCWYYGWGLLCNLPTTISMWCITCSSWIKGPLDKTRSGRGCLLIAPQLNVLKLVGAVNIIAIGWLPARQFVGSFTKGYRLSRSVVRIGRVQKTVITVILKCCIARTSIRW